MSDIVVLDGLTLSDGTDPDWSGFYALGSCTVYPRTAAAERAERLRGARYAIINKCVLDAEILGCADSLEYVGLLSTGCNAVDLKAARARGITVTNIPAYSTESVVQTLFGLLIEVASGVGAHAEAVRKGAWAHSADFCFYRPNMTELAGKRMGIVGYGRIGKRVAEVAQAFGMKVSVYVKGRTEEGRAIRFCKTLEQLLETSDVVSLNCPLTVETEKMMNAERFARMKEGAIFLNTARGGLVDEEALYDALKRKKLFGAGLDVLGTEPPREDHPLIGMPGAVITPHIGWATPEARRRLMKIASENLAAYINGAPKNVVN